MTSPPGAWTPQSDHLGYASIVQNAVKSSDSLYRNGLGMIASENIVSPAVRDIVGSDLHAVR